MTDSIVVITNADAGTADDEAQQSALEVLRRHAEVEVRATSSPEELDALLDDLGDLHGRRLVVLGGDGSIHAVMSALHRRGQLPEPVVGLIPLGTGNDFARTLGIPLDPAEAAEVVTSGTVRSIDLLVDDLDAVTVNGVHLGAGAEAGEKGARWKERLGSIGVGGVNLGRLGYPIGAFQTALNPPTLRVRVEIDGQVAVDLDDQVLMVALGNGASVGGGTELTPDASPHDGQVDVLIATPVGTLARLGYALRLPFGRHGEHADVKIVRGRSVRVTGSAFTCNSDGEIDGPVRSRSWRVLPAAYSMVVPVPSPVGQSGDESDPAA